MAFPLASTLEYLLRPRARQANDASVARQSNYARNDGDLPAGLSLQWLGTAGFAISYLGFVLLIDPFLTRPSLRDVLGRRPLPPDPSLLRRLVPRADAVLVGHTHFDHALDVPWLARESGCKAYGSRSLARLMALHGLAAQAVVVEPERVYELGPFEVRFVSSLHSKLLLGLKVPSEGELTCDHLDRLHGATYACGDVYGIHLRVADVSLYHQGSANLREETLNVGPVDYFLAGIAGRGFTRDYTARILRKLTPRVIIPHHFDNFFLPIEREMGFSLNVNLGGFMEEVARVSRDFTVRTLAPLQRVEGPSR
jgi:L-ascorbate metabolism protein UlaG (beta-lactamase superfamily)